MAKRIIAAVSAAYQLDDGTTEWANQGAEVDLSAAQEKILDEQGALVPTDFGSFQEFSEYKLDAYRGGRGDATSAARLAEARRGGIADLSAPGPSAPTADLAAYLRENKPTTDETILLAEGDPDKAAKVLEAEEVASDGKPRKGVAEGLQRVIDGGKE